MSDTRDRLLRCFAAVPTFAGLAPSELASASPKTVATWDSMATVTLVSLVEEEFQVSIAPDEFENLTSFESFLETIERALSSG
jgi:acyl carrier protein